MLSIRTLDGFSSSDMFDPSFRMINFADQLPVVFVSEHLRYGWTILPGEDTTINGVLQFIKENHQRSEDERQRLTKNVDKDSIDTPWRQSIAHLWNNVFSDVMEFLRFAAPIPRSFHPPSHEVFAVEYPSNSNEMIKKVWQRSVLIIPTYLESNVQIRITYLSEGSNEKALGTFDSSNPTEIWFIRSNVEIHIFVEGNYQRNRSGVAVVFVCGLTSD